MRTDVQKAEYQERRQKRLALAQKAYEKLSMFRTSRNGLAKRYANNQHLKAIDWDAYDEGEARAAIRYVTLMAQQRIDKCEAQGDRGR